MTWVRKPKVSPVFPPGDYVGPTAAAAIAEMSQGHFSRLAKAGDGPEFITTEDGKDAYDPTEVLLWSRHRRGTLNLGGRKKTIDAPTRIHIILSSDLLNTLKIQARKEKLPISVIIRRKLAQ